uniref:Homeobox domain-containing protein n=1 Tax=Seriola dumerili TaxID=41447 RepID=A0A3B4UJC3_SERDU
MQNTHSQLDNTQGQNTLLPPHTVQYMEHHKSSVQQELSLSPQAGQEAGEGEDDEIEEERDKDSPYNFNNPPTTALEECREEVAQNQALTLSPCSLSPGLPANISPQPQTADLQRGEPHRGRRSSRTRFTEQQLETLQGVFEATPYPREEEYDRLSAMLTLPNRVIVVWFQNARQRARKNQDRVTPLGRGRKSRLQFITD